ncbi:DUF397 domain-containing protein [Actinoalloteichus spitiensis]|uniref:DUF397 domain-containing protein n=1 Tax=Actinoalloteichus spitiensis TaxID=252394 RepID=UPI0002DE821C|nr:DUF397 domain-containing protein [Actinoalloteichus spitiensis]
MSHVPVAGWRKSRRSTSQTNCVEIGSGPAVVGIRDTKNRAAGTLYVRPDVFGAFLTALKEGRIGAGR